MRKRPIAVTVVGWLMMAAGAFGLARGFMGAGRLWPPNQDLMWIVVVDTIGIACGIFLLRGQNWARWLTLVWLGAHAVIISFFNRQAVLAHFVIFAMIAYLMFRADVREYFCGSVQPE
jgi:hypothetical protein